MRSWSVAGRACDRAQEHAIAPDDCAEAVLGGERPEWT